MSEREQVVLNGRYELHRRVGRGGMAEVYLARDRLLDRHVAIKILFPEFATDPSFVARFRREAQNAANLNHPNIVGVYDWGKERGTYYIVMEYVDGRSISDMLRSDGAFEPKRAAHIAADVAGALGYAHRKGVVHRDVKPGNVLITTSNEIKVADFGIARAMTSSGEEDLTQAGSVMGTATYFSPEQAQGKPVDPRTDLYSLGVVLYEMVAGKPPFTGDSPLAIAYKHVQEPLPPLRSQATDVPDGYEAIVNKSLAKDPGDRYPDGEAMRADLLRFCEGKSVAAAPVAAPVPTSTDPPTQATSVVAPVPVPTPTPPPAEDEHRKRTGWFFVAILVLLALLGGLLFAFGKQLGIFDDQTKQVDVPGVVGLDALTATKQLKDAGFEVDPSQKADKAKAGTVISQDPPEGTEVDEGSTISITISSGAGTATIPDLEGLTEQAARDQLTGLGFDDANITTRPQDDATAPPNTVLFTDPEAGRSYPLDGQIVLVLATEPETTTTSAVPTTTEATTTTQATTTTSTTTTTTPTTTTSTTIVTTTTVPTTTSTPGP